MTITTTAPRGREALRAIRAETLKLWSLPTTHLTAVGTLGVSAILALALATAGKQGNTGTTSSLDIGLAPIGYSQAGFIILGTVAATSEYRGGQIYVTLTAMPRRITQHLAKVVALLIVAVPAAALTVLVGVVVADVALGGTAQAPPLSDAVRVGIGASAYLALTTLISASVATVIRRSVPALAGLLVYYFIVGTLLRDQAAFANYLPDTAGHSMWFQSGAGQDGALSALAGSTVVTAWTLLAVAVSTAVFHRRDA